MDQRESENPAAALKRSLSGNPATNDEFDSPVTRPEQRVATCVSI